MQCKEIVLCVRDVCNTRHFMKNNGIHVYLLRSSIVYESCVDLLAADHAVLHSKLVPTIANSRGSCVVCPFYFHLLDTCTDGAVDKQKVREL